MPRDERPFRWQFLEGPTGELFVDFAVAPDGTLGAIYAVLPVHALVDGERVLAVQSVDTLTDLRAQHPGAEFFFITGADSLATLQRWKDYETLITLATFVGVTRPGHSLTQLDAPHVLVPVPALAVSSTDIRDRVRAGAPIRYLVPDAVAQYVEDHQLYLGGMHD